MDLRQLRHFVAVIRHGSIGRAATELNITQPALSRSIQALETRLGTELLERGPRGVHPTVFGASLLDHARAIIGEADRAEDEIKALKGMSRGNVVLGITPNFANFIVPDAIASLVERSPNIDITVLGGLYDEVIANLRRTETDLAFSMFPDTSNEMTDLTFLPQTTTRSHVFARADHPLAARDTVSLEDLSQYGWIVTNQIAMARILNQQFYARGVNNPRQVIKSTSIAFLKPAILATGLLAILPDHLVADEVADGRIVKIRQDDIEVTSQAGVIVRARGSRPPAVTAMIDALAEAAQAAANHEA